MRRIDFLALSLILAGLGLLVYAAHLFGPIAGAAALGAACILSGLTLYQVRK